MAKRAANETDIAIGKNIARMRAMRGLSMAQLGAGLSVPVTQQAIDKYERGVARVSASTLVEMAGVLGCRILDLYDHQAEGANGPATYDEAKMLRLYRELSSQGQREAIRKLVSEIVSGAASQLSTR